MAFFEIALSSRHCECTKSSFMKGISSKHSFVYCIIITKILRQVHGIVSCGLPYFVKNKSKEIWAVWWRPCSRRMVKGVQPCYLYLFFFNRCSLLNVVLFDFISKNRELGDNYLTAIPDPISSNLSSILILWVNWVPPSHYPKLVVWKSDRFTFHLTVNICFIWQLQQINA